MSRFTAAARILGGVAPAKQATWGVRGLATQASPVNMVFLGAPGVGKGTFATRLAPVFGVPTVSTGDLVRAEIKNGSDLGRQVQEYNDKGQLVPDDVITAMVSKRLDQPDAAKGFILDGFPRTVVQAASLDKEHDVNLVVDIRLPEWVLVEKLLGRRVCNNCGAGYNVADIRKEGLDMPPLLPNVAGVCDKCGAKDSLVTRADDTKEIIEDRLQVYHRHTQPLIDFYAAKDVLLHFDVKLGVRDLDRLKGDMDSVLSQTRA